MKLDRVAPTVVITSPTSTNMAKPLIQLRGYVVGKLGLIRFDLTNASGLRTNLMGYPRQSEYGANGSVTNRFECPDVELTNGLNLITLRVADAAGNVTTTVLPYDLDYSVDTNPPVVHVVWPQSGSRLGDTNFTFRGRVDDETTQVSAQVVGGGATNELRGLVERNGTLWVEGVPLASGTNFMTLTATDAAGNLGVTNLTLIRSSVELAVDLPAENQLNLPRTAVTGTTSDNNYRIWVNGVSTLPTNGVWTALDVPVTTGGVAVFTVTAIPLSDNFGNGSAAGGDPGDPSTQNPTSPDATGVNLQSNKPAETVTVRGNWECEELDLGLNGAYYYWQYIWSWDENTGGYAERTHTEPLPGGEMSSGLRYWLRTNGVERFEQWVETPDNVVSTNAVSLSDWFWSGFNIKGPWADGELDCSFAYGYGFYDFQMAANDVKVEYRPGGKPRVGKKDLFVASGGATETVENIPVFLLYYAWPFVDGADVPPGEVLVPGFGKKLGSDNRAYAVLPAGDPIDVTYQAERPYYWFSPSVSQHRLRITANSQDCQPISWMFLPTFIVGQYVAFESICDQVAPYSGSPPGLLDYLTTNQWIFGGHYFNTNFLPCGNCSVSNDVNLSLLRTEPSTAWWVSGGSYLLPKAYAVELDQGLFFENGHRALMPSVGAFRTWRPSTLITAAPGTVALDTNLTPSGTCNRLFGLHCGARSDCGEIDGISISNYTTLPGVFSGDVQWQQVVSYSMSYENDAGDCKTKGQTNVLDTINGDNPYRDSPGNDIDRATFHTTSFQRSDDFKTTLMFRPTVPSGVWVPLGKVTWGWSGSGSWTGPSDRDWHLDNKTDPDPVVTYDEDYPFWEGLADPNLGWNNCP